MLRIEVGPDDLAASRFGIAPLTELDRLIRRLAQPHRSTGIGSNALPLRWLSRYLDVRDSLDFRVIRALQPIKWGPDFLAPPPTGLARTVAADLAAVRSAPRAEARREIRLARAAVGSAAADVDEFLAHPQVVEHLGDALERLWDHLIAPDWPQLLAIAERDVLHRAEALAGGGWAAALRGLHPRLRWDDGAVVIRNRPASTVQLDGRGLMFVPSVFMHPQLGTSVDSAWQPSIVYPARGSAALWTESVATPEALARLLGAARADLLTQLEVPSSTTQLTRLTGLSLGAVGDHLRILLEAGFVNRARAGRSVIYRRTPIADAVIAGAEVS